MNSVKVNALYQHTSGRIYQVIAVTNAGTTNEQKYPVTVVYQNVVNLTLWSRPLNDWNRSFTQVAQEAADIAKRMDDVIWERIYAATGITGIPRHLF